MTTRVLGGRLAFLGVSSIQKALPLLILPFLTATLGSERYGQVAVLVSCFTLVSMTLGLGLESITYRFGKRTDSESKGFMIAAAALQRFAPIMVGLLAAFVIILTGVRIGGTSAINVALELFAASVYCSAWQFPTSLARVRGNTRWYFFLAIAYSILLAASKLLFVLWLDLGVTGWAIADVTASFFLFLFTFRDFSPYLRDFRSNWRNVNLARPLALGSPLTVSAVSQWINGSLDRILVAAILGLSTAGQYALAAQVVAIGAVIVTELTKYVQPHLTVDSSHEGREVLARVAPRHIFLVSLVCVVTAIVGAFLAPVVFGPSFSRVGYLSSIMAVPLVFNGLSYLGMEYLSITRGKTRSIAVISLVTAAVSVMLNLLLLPLIGISGAVWSLGITSLLTFILIWLRVVRSGIELRTLMGFFWSIPVSIVIIVSIAWMA